MLTGANDGASTPSAAKFRIKTFSFLMLMGVKNIL